VRKQHTGERPFKCEYEGCSKAFFASGQLKEHTRSHTGEKLAQCPQCNKMLRCPPPPPAPQHGEPRPGWKLNRVWKAPRALFRAKAVHSKIGS
jgi:uncharacterized Zn-finger protein